MRKILTLAMLLLGLSIAFTSCEKQPEPEPEPTPVSVTGITLDSSSLTLTEGESATLIATISPSNADNQGVIWSSSDASVASVSNGTVTAVAAGSATITAKSDDGGKTATCEITVNSKIVAVTGVSLDKTSLELTKGEEYTLVATVLPENATDKSVSWSSDNYKVATVNNGKITAVGSGDATITVRTTDGEKTATCNVTVKNAVPEAVDLGLSVKWASFNIGASAPEEYGEHYAWGEVETKSKYSVDTYKFSKSEDDGNGFTISGYTKYVRQSDANTTGFHGFYDNKTELDPEDDVAHVKLGGKWRIPTGEEWEELINNCQHDWTTYKGIKGMKLTSKKEGYTDKWVFLPGAGNYSGNRLQGGGWSCEYWSSSLSPDFPSTAAWYALDWNGIMEKRALMRDYGCSIRPVCE